MLDWVQPLLDWVAQHPSWALLLIVGLAFMDAMFLVGFLFPSFVILLGVGALIGLDAVRLWPGLMATTLGAMLGDLFNYSIGARYGRRILHSRFAERYRETIDAARRFFNRHGAKSIVLGRFIGVIRPCVPAVAAASGMRLLPFLLWDASACFAWSLAFVLPGIAMGASLHLAAEIATRLVLLLFAVAGLVWGLLLVTRLVARYVQHHGEVWLVWLLRWSRRHRRVGRLGSWLADPGQPETPALAILALLLLLLGWLGLGLSWWWLRGYPQPLDALVYQALSELHVPWGLTAASWVALLGDLPVMLVAATVAFLSLLSLRQGRAAAHLAAGVGLACVIALGLYAGVQLAEPAQFYSEGDAHSRFLGSDLILTTVIYGLIPVLLSVGRDERRRTRYYGIAVALVGLIVASQLYMGLQWFSTAVFAVAIGTLWTLVLAVGFRRHNAQKVPGRRFFMPVLLGFGAALIAFAPFRAHPPPGLQPQLQTTLWQWLHGGYGQLPAYRGDIVGRHSQPMNLQWLGEEAGIRQALAQAGWSAPMHLSLITGLRMLASESTVAELPVLPQIHNGRHPDIVMTRVPPGGDETGRYEAVLRLWRSAWDIDGTPIWVGAVSLQSTRALVYLLQVPVSLQDFDMPQAALEIPDGFVEAYVDHPDYDPAPGLWSGKVRLIRPRPSDPNS